MVGEVISLRILYIEHIPQLVAAVFEHIQQRVAFEMLGIFQGVGQFPGSCWTKCDIRPTKVFLDDRL